MFERGFPPNPAWIIKLAGVHILINWKEIRICSDLIIRKSFFFFSGVVLSGDYEQASGSEYGREGGAAGEGGGTATGTGQVRWVWSM